MFEPDFILIESRKLYWMCVYFMFFSGKEFTNPAEAALVVDGMTPPERISFYRKEIAIPDHVVIQEKEHAHRQLLDRQWNAASVCLLDLVSFFTLNQEAKDYAMRTYPDFFEMFSHLSPEECFAVGSLEHTLSKEGGNRSRPLVLPLLPASTTSNYQPVCPASMP